MMLRILSLVLVSFILLENCDGARQRSQMQSQSNARSGRSQEPQYATYDGPLTQSIRDFPYHAWHVGDKTPRDILFTALNFRGTPEETALLRAFLENIFSLARHTETYLRLSQDVTVENLRSHVMRSHQKLRDPEMQNPPLTAVDEMCDMIRAMTPQNIIDGMFAATFVPRGVPEKWEMLVNKVLREEQGNGDFEKNHPWLWQQLLDQTGYDLGAANSEKFVYNKALSDWVMIPAAYQAAMGVVHGYIPEKLGVIGEYETTSSIANLVLRRRSKPLGIDWRYFNAHVGIDNMVSGHGANILDAMDDYLVHPALEDKAASTQEILNRMLVGWVIQGQTWEEIALSRDPHLNTGCPSKVSSEEFIEFLPNTTIAWAEDADLVEEEMINIVTRYAHLAVEFHGPKFSEMNYLMMNDPEGFLTYLKNNDLVVPGSPGKSRFWKLMQFHAPMFEVFNDYEQQIIETWIYNLGQGEACLSM